MEAHRIPVPRVPSPPISAPSHARNPRSIVPPPEQPAPPEPLALEAITRIPDLVPNRAAELLYSAVRKGHELIFRWDDEPGAPQPRTPGSWTFSVIGDYGSGRPPLTDVARNMAAGAPDLIVTTGDNVYYAGTEKEYRKKWDPPNMFGSLRERFPVMPSLGNHDTVKSTTPYFRRFPELKGARYYSFDHRNVHFVSVNTNESLEPGSPQLEWLESDLARSDKDWKVVFMHHPMLPGYPGGPSPNYGHLGPVLARQGVDLVLSGHAHNFMRSKPLNDAGTIEVVTGGGGQSLHPFVTPQPDHVAYRDVDFGHVEFEVRPDALVGRYVVRDGSVRDTFTIENRTPAAPGRVEPAAAEVAPAATVPVGAS